MSDKPWDKFDSDWGPSKELLLRRPTIEETLDADWKTLRGIDPEAEYHVSRMSDEKIREFVLGVLDGTLYTSASVKDQNILPMVFMPVALGGLKDFPEDKLKEVGGLYARMSTAMPRSINGYPIFPEVCLVHRDDWARAWKAIRREDARRSELEI